MFSKLSINPFPFRACLNCGSWMNLRIFFCEQCHTRCLQQFNLEYPATIKIQATDRYLQSKKNRSNQIKVKSLFRWPPGKSDVLSSLVLQMKEENQIAWLVWAQEFILKWESTINLKETILISSESVSGKTHAQNWGLSLSQKLGYPHICPLRPRFRTKSQKSSSRLERTQREMELCVDFSTLQSKRIIFVDDIVTTGQTALAAYYALNKPRNFEVWSLIYREL